MSNAKPPKVKAIPLYYQLEVSLRSRLASGEFVPGDALPSEAEIGDKYNMSRITVRQALGALEREGLISRQRGRGTFVTKQVKKLWTPKLSGSLDDAISMGLTDKYEVKLISREEEPASHREADLLGLELGEQIHRIQRIRLYEHKPLAYMINIMPLDVGTGLSTKDLMSRPVMANLEVSLGLKLSEADQRIGATLADAQIAEFLNIRTGDPLLQMERTTFEAGGRAVNHASVLFRADRYWYQVKLRHAGKMGQSDWVMV
jgi:GntR family transcriptional regulator